MRALEIHPTQVYLTYLNLRGATGCAGPLTPSALIVMIPWFKFFYAPSHLNLTRILWQICLPSSWIQFMTTEECPVWQYYWGQTNKQTSPYLWEGTWVRTLPKWWTSECCAPIPTLNQWVSLGGWLNYSYITKTHQCSMGDGSRKPVTWSAQSLF